jgi:hypothetical protein
MRAAPALPTRCRCSKLVIEPGDADGDREGGSPLQMETR